jgi:hypothetical protein
MEALWIALIAVAVVAAIGVGIYLKIKRQKELQAFASSNALQFSRTDPFGHLAMPFRLFKRGDGRGVENVMWGSWQDQPIRLFDYWYYTESTDSEGRTSRSYRHFSCASYEVPGSFPSLVLSPENVFTRAADRVGLPDIQFELEEFNRAWTVKAKDRKFANDVVDQRMMQFLLSLPERLSFELVGNRVLVYRNRMKPRALPVLAGVATTFRDRIPRVVWSLYPAS